MHINSDVAMHLSKLSYAFCLMSI